VSGPPRRTRPERLRHRRLAACLWTCLAALPCFVAEASGAMNDDELRGYAMAVLQREFNLRPDAVSVEGGVVVIRGDVTDSDRMAIKEILGGVEGVKEIRFIEEDTRPTGFDWLPLRSQFRPLLADPRWPHFAGSYQYYFEGAFLGNTAGVDLGETFALVRYNLEVGGTLELAVQAGVFAVFDIDSESFDLVNADYLGGIPLTYATGNLSAMLRIFHQSSHLGDEFVLRNQVTRINFSYEEIDALVSYEIGSDLRVYGGFGYVFHVEPSNYRPWSLQFGGEWVALGFDLPLGAKPMVALDLQPRQEGGWETNVSLRGGFEFGEPVGTGTNLQTLLEFFHGQSPNGQFYPDTVGYVGIGVHFYF
jgi:hypothetical protein